MKFEKWIFFNGIEFIFNVTPLMNAASSDSQEVVKCILKQPNIEINSKDIWFNHFNNIYI